MQFFLFVDVCCGCVWVSRVYQAVFDGWFLLVQCGFWVDTAAELLVLAESENSEPLLWLLTFFHHPTNRGHQRSHQTVRDLIMELQASHSYVTG